ncbi:hypothetical protein F1559_004598 [Cyanidiococcus yangmingshanensis]|uniref:Uncharacterized protein n=1 Tax=Cyanidiococcus yangmingshanensis TaxID=2690220 RepID=A0A7J7IKE4_9RHOD|nr:hypothetical protein F1559_004598 [Cyanidiococcus yangmingshanensis]
MFAVLVRRRERRATSSNPSSSTCVYCPFRAPFKCSSTRRSSLSSSGSLKRSWTRCSSASLNDSGVDRLERTSSSNESLLFGAGQHWVEQFISALTGMLESLSDTAAGEALESLLAADACWRGDLIERAVGASMIRHKLEQVLRFWEHIGWYVPPGAVEYTLISNERRKSESRTQMRVDIRFIASGLWPLPWRPRVLCTGTLSVELEMVDSIAKLQARTLKDTVEPSSLLLLRQLFPGLADLVSAFVAPLPENDALLEQRVNARAQKTRAATSSPDLVTDLALSDPNWSSNKAAPIPVPSNETTTADEDTQWERGPGFRFRWPLRCFRERSYRPYFECYLLPGEPCPGAIRSAPDGVFPCLPAYVFNFSRFRRRLVLDPQEFSFVTPVQVRRWLLSELGPEAMTMLARKDTAPVIGPEYWSPESQTIFDPETLYDLLESQIAQWSSLMTTNEESLLQWRFPIPIRFTRGSRIVMAPHPYADAFGRGEATTAATVSGVSLARHQAESRQPCPIYDIHRALSDAVLQRLEGGNFPPLPSRDAHGRVLVRYTVSEDGDSIFYARRCRGLLSPERLLRIRYDLLMDLRSTGRVPRGWLPHETRWRLSCYDCSVAFDEDGEISVAVYRSSRPQFCIFQVALEVPRNLSAED